MAQDLRSGIRRIEKIVTDIPRQYFDQVEAIFNHWQKYVLEARIQQNLRSPALPAGIGASLLRLLSLLLKLYHSPTNQPFS